MNAIELFLARYQGVHTTETDRLLSGVTEGQMRSRPHPAVNSIAWLLWHLGRCEDVAVNRLVADRPQVLEEDGWAGRLGTDRRDIGMGMTFDEVDAVSRAFDLDALRGYWVAVGERTLQVARALPADDLATVVSDEHIHQVVCEEGVAIGPVAEVLEAYWRNRTKAWFLLQLCIYHVGGHFFDIGVVKGLHRHGVSA